jgi:hypothetical protein
MKKLKISVILGIFCGLFAIFSFAEEVSKEQIKGLDEQVQEIKKDVLGISTELNQLEEKLLYPSNTQVSIFVSIVKGDKFRLDAVKLKVDGKEVTHHIYTFKELEALQAGGVQRLYTGNIRSGEHTLEVSLIGKGKGKSEYKQNASHKFTKSVEPKLIEMVLAGPDSSSNQIEFKD